MVLRFYDKSTIHRICDGGGDGGGGEGGGGERGGKGGGGEGCGEGGGGDVGDSDGGGDGGGGEGGGEGGGGDGGAGGGEGGGEGGGGEGVDGEGGGEGGGGEGGGGDGGGDGGRGDGGGSEGGGGDVAAGEKAAAMEVERVVVMVTAVGRAAAMGVEVRVEVRAVARTAVASQMRLQRGLAVRPLRRLGNRESTCSSVYVGYLRLSTAHAASHTCQHHYTLHTTVPPHHLKTGRLAWGKLWARSESYEAMPQGGSTASVLAIVHFGSVRP